MLLTQGDYLQMEKLCLHYGPEIGHVGMKTFHDMPTPFALTAPGVEAHLRQLGFGYRAKYLHRTAVMVAEELGVGWLDNLRNPESPVIGVKPSDAGDMLPGGREGYRSAHEELLALQGVGPKVADCVCLMGLGWGEAVPVDTHGTTSLVSFYCHFFIFTDDADQVWQIAQRDYKFGKGKHSSLTKSTYDAVGDKFRSLWGKDAGWAHSVLFTADLRSFSERLTTKIEAKEIKGEKDSKILTEIQLKAGVFTPINVKREFEDEETPLMALDDIMAKRPIKRRRKADADTEITR